MQFLTPEGSKFLSSETNELLNGLLVALIFTGLCSIGVGMRSVWKLLHSVKDLVSKVQPELSAHLQSDETNFVKVFAEQKVQSVMMSEMNGKLDIAAKIDSLMANRAVSSGD